MMKYLINDTVISYEASGEKRTGPNEILVHQGIDVSAGKPWSDRGFTIAKLFPEQDYDDFIRQAVALLRTCWRNAGLQVSDDFTPVQYHLIASTARQHLDAIEQTRLLGVADFPAGIRKIEERISEICGVPLQAKNPFDGQAVFHFRVIRPGSRDNNPLHRDVWLDDYKSCINLYIPVAGSNDRSSLILLPGSHLWPESRVERTVGGAVINGTKFNVPAVTAIKGEYTIERPDPRDNQVLVFSPYLIHGGAVNLNTEATRISIELRLWIR